MRIVSNRKKGTHWILLVRKSHEKYCMHIKWMPLLAVVVVVVISFCCCFSRFAVAMRILCSILPECACVCVTVDVKKEKTTQKKKKKKKSLAQTHQMKYHSTVVVSVSRPGHKWARFIPSHSLLRLYAAASGVLLLLLFFKTISYWLSVCGWTEEFDACEFPSWPWVPAFILIGCYFMSFHHTYYSQWIVNFGEKKKAFPLNHLNGLLSFLLLIW